MTSSPTLLGWIEYKSKREIQVTQSSEFTRGKVTVFQRSKGRLYRRMRPPFYHEDRNTNFEPQLTNVLSPKKNYILLINRPVTQNNILNHYYYIFNFINKNFVKICFLFCCLSIFICIRSSIFPLGPQNLKYLLSGPLRKSLPTYILKNSGPWSCCGM